VLVNVVNLIHTPISKTDYLSLVEDVGWKRYVNADVVDTALQNTLWSATAVDSETGAVIGYVRIVGDGAIFFYEQDLMVRKSHRKQGIGRALMESANLYLKKETPKKSAAGLFTHPSKEGFYQKFNFHSPCPSLIGMYKKTKG